LNRITWISPYLDVVLDEIPICSRNILEVGCGSGIFGYILKKTRPFSNIQGIEPFRYDLPHYDFLWRTTWKQYITTKRNNDIPNHFDVLVCNETIEHMEKNNALSFLSEVKTISDKIIIVTPYKFEQQSPYDNNEYQIHRCVMTLNDFKSEGYTVKLIGFNNKNGIRMIYNPSIYSKMLKITPTNIMAIYDKSLLIDESSKSGGK
jgi:hypothetical protein